MRILITGGTGFFGRALLRFWKEIETTGTQPPSICVVTRNPVGFLAQHPEFDAISWLSFHQGDVLRPESFPKNAAFTHILHAATDSTVGPQHTPFDRYTQIVDGTRNLLDYAVVRKIPRFLLTSSGGVYGPQPHDMERIPEHYNGMPDPLNAQHTYSVAKRCAEHLCALYQDRHGIQPIIARCFAFVGRDLPLNVHFAMGNFIRDALWRDEITVSGDGTAVRSYLDQSDLAVWLLTLLENGKPGHAYNVGSDRPISIVELAQLVRNTISPNKRVSILANASATNMTSSRYVPDISRAREELALNVNVTLEDAIRNTARAHK